MSLGWYDDSFDIRRIQLTKWLAWTLSHAMSADFAVRCQSILPGEPGNKSKIKPSAWQLCLCSVSFFFIGCWKSYRLPVTKYQETNATDTSTQPARKIDMAIEYYLFHPLPRFPRKSLWTRARQQPNIINNNHRWSCAGQLQAVFPRAFLFIYWGSGVVNVLVITLYKYPRARIYIYIYICHWGHVLGGPGLQRLMHALVDLIHITLLLFLSSWLPATIYHLPSTNFQLRHSGEFPGNDCGLKQLTALRFNIKL